MPDTETDTRLETACKYRARLGQGGFDGRGQPTASPMLTAIMEWWSWD